MDKPTLWTCPHGHVLGIVVRTGVGKGVLLFRHPVRLEDFEAVPKRGAGVLFWGRVRCEICGAERAWYPDERDLARQLRHIRGRRHEVSAAAG